MIWQQMDAEVLQEFLRSRRSIRHFQSQPVPEMVLARILETGMWAPSAHNRQPWRFAVVVSQEAKSRLGAAMGAEFQRVLQVEGLSKERINAMVERSRRRLLEAPVALVLCLDPTDMDVHEDPNRAAGEKTMAVQSVALAGGTILLAAHAEGLGGVWVCAPLFTPEIVRDALDLPAAWMAQGMIFLGYPAQASQSRSRLSVDKVTLYR